MTTIKKTLGWLGDLIAQHVYHEGAPQAMRRRWNLTGFTVADDTDEEWLDISPDPSWVLDGLIEVSEFILDSVAPIEFRVGGTTILSIGASGITFGETLSAPTITQAETDTASATGGTLTLAAQSTTGASSVGGDVFITPGAGVSDNGQGRLRGVGAVEALMWGGAFPTGAKLGFFGAVPILQPLVYTNDPSSPPAMTGGDTVALTTLEDYLGDLYTYVNAIADRLEQLGLLEAP
jgi:hypothetical protein